MTKLTIEQKPDWLPGDYNSGNVVRLEHNAGYILVKNKDNNVARRDVYSIIVQFDDGSEIDKRYVDEEFPGYLKDWTWLQWNYGF